MDMPIRASLSPRDVARAVGVSESTLKRWVDAGELDAQRTKGGHRRIAVEEAIRFLHRSQRKAARPEVLGLLNASALEGSGAVDLLHQRLAEGNASDASQLIVSAWVAGTSVAAICDEIIQPAMAKIGELWDGKLSGIFEEHRASCVAMEALDQLGSALPITENAPLAIGGAIGGDTSAMPSLMASVALKSEGFNVMNLGADTPCVALAQAARELRPTLVWVSAGYVADAEAQRQDLLELCQAINASGATIVLGGRRIQDLRIQATDRVRIGNSMSDLAEVGRQVLSRAKRSTSTNGSSHGNGHVNGNGQANGSSNGRPSGKHPQSLL